jgi:hypothetical protein
MTVFDCSIVEIDKHSLQRGNISVVGRDQGVPFDIERVFWLYDIPVGEARGAHAHRECHQFLIAAHGAFEVTLDDGRNRRTVQLNRPYFGLHIPPGIWAAEQGFSSGAICLVLTSHPYAEADYIRSYEEFLSCARGGNENTPPHCKTLIFSILAAA